MSTKALMLKATILFPRTPYLDEAAVRHARRGWIRCQQILAERRK